MKEKLTNDNQKLVILNEIKGDISSCLLAIFIWALFMSAILIENFLTGEKETLLCFAVMICSGLFLLAYIFFVVKNYFRFKKKTFSYNMCDATLDSYSRYGFIYNYNYNDETFSIISTHKDVEKVHVFDYDHGKKIYAVADKNALETLNA